MNVQLRAWTAADADWYAEAVRDPEVQRFTTESPTTTAAEVAAAIAALPGNPAAESFLVVAGEDDARCGNVAVDLLDGIGHVSYFVAAAARGRGVATEALARFVEWIVANRQVSELRLWTHADNVASRRVAERVGFTRDPGRDQPREIKGATWPTVAYRLPVSGRPAACTTG